MMLFLGVAAKTRERKAVLDIFFRARWLSVVAVLFAGLGAALMMLVGAVTTLEAVGEYFGAGEEESFSEEAALSTTTLLVSSLDEFLLGLVLFIFAYGVFRLFIIDQREDRDVPDWFSIHSVTDLKVKLLETIAILLAVVFLKAVLSTPIGEALPWSALVTPIAVGIFALSILVLRRAH